MEVSPQHYLGGLPQAQKHQGGLSGRDQSNVARKRHPDFSSWSLTPWPAQQRGPTGQPDHHIRMEEVTEPTDPLVGAAAEASAAATMANGEG